MPVTDNKFESCISNLILKIIPTFFKPINNAHEIIFFKVSVQSRQLNFKECAHMRNKSIQRCNTHKHTVTHMGTAVIRIIPRDRARAPGDKRNYTPLLQNYTYFTLVQRQNILVVLKYNSNTLIN